MQSAATAIEQILPSNRTRTGLLLLILGLITPAILAFIAGRNLVAVILLGAPVLMLLLSNRRWTFYLFLLSLTLYFPIRFSFIALHPFDLAMGLLTASVIVDFLLHGRSEIRTSGVDQAFLLLIGATFLSAITAHNLSLSIVPLGRIIAIYICFRVVFTLALDLSVQKIIMIFIVGIALLALVNVFLFIARGGAVRIFGPAWLAIETYTMTALPMALCFFIWARSRSEAVFFGLTALIISMGIMATQSRAPMLSVTITIPILLFFAWRKTGTDANSQPRRRLKNIFTLAVIAALPVIAFSSTIFLPMLERADSFIVSLTKPQGTIALRIVLWTAALKGFLLNPITGVGIGNFKVIDQMVPSMKVSPVWYYIRGLSAHSVVMQYLCETGLVGLLALLNLAYRGLKLGRFSFRQKLSNSDRAVAASLLMAMIVFAHTIIYMRSWTWAQGGYVLAIIFALTAAFALQLRPRAEA